MAAKANKKTASKASGKSKGAHAGKKKPAPQSKPIRREVGAVVCFFLGLFSFIGYFQVEAWFISIFCAFIKGLVGYGYYIFPPALLVCTVILAAHHGRPVRLRTVSTLLLPLVAGALAHALFFRGELDFSKFSSSFAQLYRSGMDMHSGGVISGLLAQALESTFSIYGAVPVFVFAIVALIFISFRISLGELLEQIRSRPHLEYEEEEEELYAKPLKEKTAPERPSPSHAPAAGKAARVQRAIDIPLDEEAHEELFAEKKQGFFNTKPRVKTPDQLLNSYADQAQASVVEPTRDVQPLSVEEAAELAGVTPVEIKSEEVISEEKRQRAGKKLMNEAELQAETEAVARSIAEGELMVKPEYQYPPLELLKKGSASKADGKEEMAINRERLQATLNSFGVNASITDITRGPTVTRYDLELEAGVKLTKLTNLAGDLALSLGVTSVRIAPIPDKIATVGVEVPNKIVSTVYLSDIIGSDSFKNAPSKLTFAIGEDIGGNSICGNIAKLPHMLIAGTTGSGKSVCMNSLILSMLYKAKPDEVKLIMIDPKMVELGIYNGIPHLYIPVVTDPKKAAGALQWAVVEMLKRYRLFSEVGVRDLASYNSLQERNGEDKLPQVVIVIDELADLMLVASKEVEESICRVAQMGRASGMHLVIATQRPSADVITGLMKANIPSRIAFAVSSAMESRIILDTQGAEKLVGSGDMLYAPIGVGKPKRIQGAFVSDEEREQVVNFVKQNGGDVQYNDEIMAQIEKAASAGKDNVKAESVEENDGFGAYDDMLPQAVEVIFETKQASVSMLQRRLKLGYSRAARIVDQMEELGIVGPFEGSKPRQIMITKEQWQEMQLLNGTAPMQMGLEEFADELDTEPEDNE